MSRMTAAQVIALGEYLNPDFDPASLTVAQLLGVFGFHNVKYPSQYTKPKLVQLFNDEIKSKARKLTRERIKRENSQASEDGITDGMTGRPINEAQKAARRSSRRLSKTPALQEDRSDAEVPAPPQPKRRRSAEPSLGGPSRRRTTKPSEPVVVEESEPEEVVVRKVGRSKKNSSDAATQSRRAVQQDTESGWEDNNVFQSGAESSSPARPSPRRTRRSAAPTRPPPKSRKSMSAPPEVSSPPKEVRKTRASSIKPPESDFEPRLPAFLPRSRPLVAELEHTPLSERVVRRQLSVVPDGQEEEVPHYEDDEPVSDSIPHDPTHAEPIEDVEAPEEEAEFDGVEYDEDGEVTAVAQRIAEGGQVVKREAKQGSPLLSWLFILFAAMMAYPLLEYKQESASIGFCDAGQATNHHLDALRAHRALVQSCNLENRTTLYPVPPSDGTTTMFSPSPTATPQSADVSSGDIVPKPCPPPPLLDFLHADACTPCPKHATCTPETVTCENGFILRSHPALSFIPVPTNTSTSAGSMQVFQRPRAFTADTPPLAIYSLASIVGDGLLGSVGFPPRCVEDSRRKRHIGVLGKALESLLGAERGRRLCEGNNLGVPESDTVAEAIRWGMELGKLKDDVKKKTSPNLLPTFDDTFNEAVQQLLQWGGVFMGEDADGKRYLAHKSAHMRWHCALKVWARNLWLEWRGTVIMLAGAALSLVYAKRSRAQKAIEGERVAQLVNVALDCLRNQELAHHTDPVMVSRPYLSSLQLRDLVLQDVHSVSERKRLWARVERVVESNANVRTNLEEVEGGDEQRVWQWVGSAGQTLASPEKPRLLDFGARGEGGRVIA